MATTSVETTVDPVDVNVQQRALALFQSWKEKELADLVEQQDADIQEKVKAYFVKLEEEQKPLTKDQLQQLLDQEYVTFTIKIQGRASTVKEFTICELPQEAEVVFYKQFKDRVYDKAASVAALAQETMDRSFEEKIKAFLETFEGAFDMIADATVLVLNYDKHDQDITREWCQQNLNSWRMWNICKAQMEVNRLRDFFSEVSLSGMKSQTMTTPLNVHSLQEVLRK